MVIADGVTVLYGPSPCLWYLGAGYVFPAPQDALLIAVSV